MICRPNN